MNDSRFCKLIRTRRTAHFYDSEPVPEEVLREALECAARAPNHKLTNPWRFTRVGPETRAKIVELAVELKKRKKPLSDRQEARVREKVASSPELLVVRQVLDEDPFRRREDYAACACAIQNLSLALWSHGVSSKWSSGSVTRASETYELLGVDPDREEIIGFVWIGYAEEQPETPRLPVEEVLDEVP